MVVTDGRANLLRAHHPACRGRAPKAARRGGHLARRDMASRRRRLPGSADAGDGARAGSTFVDVLPIALVLLMSAVPVALPVMFTVSMAVGSMELGRRGVLITRLSAIEDAANMDVLCADKTGTLTMNQLSLTGALPEAGFTESDVVRAGALASNEANADPIDVAFLRAAKDRKLEDADAEDDLLRAVSPQDAPHRGRRRDRRKADARGQGRAAHRGRGGGYGGRCDRRARDTRK